MGRGREVASSTKRVAARLVSASGYEVHRIERSPRMEYLVEAAPLYERRAAQTAENVAILRERYRDPVFGVVPVWNLVDQLAHVIDQMDRFLMNVSQEVHTAQVIEGMLDDGVSDETILLAGVLHDLGKLLYLTDEDPANISGTVRPIGANEPGQGLSKSTLQWNHDEIAFTRFDGRVPDHVAWLIRYHSIDPVLCRPLMDERDLDYYERYWKDFARWDFVTKSIHRVPRVKLRDYRSLVEDVLPDPIPF